METLKQIILQETNEERYNRKHIDAKIRQEILANPAMVNRLHQGVELVNAYMAKTYYESKMKRIAQLQGMDIPTLVLDIFVGIAYVLREQLFTSVSAQMSSRLKLSDRTEAITTIAELLAVLCATDAYDITKASTLSSLMLVSRIELSDELIKFIEGCKYLPPMVCEPLELTHNYSSGYLTHNDSLILGKRNHHDGDICLDVLNTMNRVSLKLDTKFLSTVEEDPSEITVEKMIESALKKGKIITTATAKERVRAALDNWDNFKEQSYSYYRLMMDCDNHFYLTNKVDKRGRIYSMGYYINPQGTSFKKASLEFANEEIVSGV